MAEGSENSIPHNEIWATDHKKEIAEVEAMMEDHAKAIVIEGPVGSGKTSLARAVADNFSKPHDDNEPRVTYITSRAVGETPRTQPIPPISDRTGVKYEQLPRPDEVAQAGQVLLTIDEVDRAPDEVSADMWHRYFQLPNITVLLLTHTGQQGSDEWIKLFNPDDLIGKVTLSPEGRIIPAQPKAA